MAGQCGVAIGVGGQPVAVEWFASPSAIKAHVTPLVRAVAFDAIAERLAEEVPSRRIRRMVAHFAGAQLTESAPDRGAVALNGETAHLLIRGIALDDGGLAHLSILNRQHPLLEMKA